MSLLAFYNTKIYSDQDIWQGRAILVEGSLIRGIVNDTEIPSHFTKIDLGGLSVAPGLIDLQIYGSDDVLFAAQRDVKALKHISETIVASGTTGFIITVATLPLNAIREAIAAVNSDVSTACLGLHLEGPYLNPARNGAHPKEWIRPAELHELTELLDGAGENVKIMTIAPELFDQESLDYLRSRNIVLSAGHSMATYAESWQAFSTGGVTLATHLFNAMTPWHHRDMGLPGAVMMAPDVRASIIADGIHVSYESLEFAKKLMGERLFLITDAVTGSTMDPYRHKFAGDRYTLPDGTLSGSALTLWQAVKNCVDHCGIPLDEAIRMATTYPARAIGYANGGRIHQGASANMIVFDDNLTLNRVIFEGKTIIK